MKKLFLAFCLLFLGFCSTSATNDLVITAITRTADGTTLKWLSVTGEFYVVYATEDLNAPIRWRVGSIFMTSRSSTIACSGCPVSS